MKEMKIGWSEVNITPEKKASLAGQFAERISFIAVHSFIRSPPQMNFPFHPAGISVP